MLALVSLATPAAADTIVLTPANAGYYVTPPQWNESSNTVVCVGAGSGGSGGGVVFAQGGSGGGGGASDVVTNLAIEGLIGLNIPTGGAGGTPGNQGGGNLGDNGAKIWGWGFIGTGHISCGARNSLIGGNGGQPASGGNTGLAQGTGYAGGNGGLGGTDSVGLGVHCTTTCAGGGGGGASGSTGIGADGTQYSAGSGGAGGQGDAGTGGAGGTSGGGAGANGTEIGGGVGAGGGGGGGSTGINGGDAGSCGGGGGGAGDATKSGGAGRDACIILTYTPTSDQTLGYHGSAFTTFNDNVLINCHSWTAPITGIGTAVSFSPNTSLSGNIVFGVYDSNSSTSTLYPGALLAQTGQVTNPSSGLQSAPLLSQFNGVRGHLYWICDLPSAAIHWNGGALQETELGYSQSYTTTLPNLTSTSSSGSALFDRPILYVTLTPGTGPASGTPNPLFTGD